MYIPPGFSKIIIVTAVVCWFSPAARLFFFRFSGFSFPFFPQNSNSNLVQEKWLLFLIDPIIKIWFSSQNKFCCFSPYWYRILVPGSYKTWQLCSGESKDTLLKLLTVCDKHCIILRGKTGHDTYSPSISCGNGKSVANRTLVIPSILCKLSNFPLSAKPSKIN